MPRPCKRRRIRGSPNFSYFKPSGIRKMDLQELILSLEELESLRLQDFLNLEQEESAKRMEVSQSTFSRILSSARKKVSDALINGKAIRIEGGNYYIDN